MALRKDGDRYRAELRSTVLALMTAIPAASRLPGAAGAVVLAVLAATLVVTLAAWCGPLVVDAINRTLDERDAGRRRRRSPPLESTEAGTGLGEPSDRPTW